MVNFHIFTKLYRATLSDINYRVIMYDDERDIEAPERQWPDIWIQTTAAKYSHSKICHLY